MCAWLVCTYEHGRFFADFSDLSTVGSSRSSPRYAGSPGTAFNAQQDLYQNARGKSTIQLNGNNVKIATPPSQDHILDHQIQQQQFRRQNPLSAINFNSNLHNHTLHNDHYNSTDGLTNNHLLQIPPAHLINSNSISNHSTTPDIDNTERKVTFFISESSPDSPEDSSEVECSPPKDHNQALAAEALRLLQHQHESTIQELHDIQYGLEYQQPLSVIHDVDGDDDDDDDISIDDDLSQDEESDDDDDISDESDYDSDWSKSTAASEPRKNIIFEKLEVAPSPLPDDLDHTNTKSDSSAIPRIGGPASRSSLSLLSQAIENSELKRAKPSIFSGLARIVAAGGLAPPPPLTIPNEADLPPPPMVELSASLRENLASERRMPFGAVIKGSRWYNNGDKDGNADATCDVFRVTDSYSELSGW